MNDPDGETLTAPENETISLAEPCIHKPEGRLTILRGFLQRNKIFFETVAATLLSLMAIIISAAQIFISVKQNALTEMQTEIAKQQAMPQFVIAARQVIDSFDGKAKEDTIYVTNRGGIVRDLLSNTAVFFDVEVMQEQGNQKKVEIPANGYYRSTMHTAEGAGQVLVIEGYLNNEKLSQLRKDFQQLAHDRKAFGKIELRRYIKLYYLDILGKEHVDYYYVPLIYGGRPIEPRDGKAIFSKHKAAIENASIAEFDRLTADNLLKRVK